MATWLDDILTAFGNLGGTARYPDLYVEIRRLRTASLPRNDWTPTVRERIERHSSDSIAGPARGSSDDLFYKVGRGQWGLRGHLARTPIAADIGDAIPTRSVARVYRILRDTDLARTLKALHGNRCQMCGTVITLSPGTRYSEAHHIKPLGSPHHGPDVAGNILVLCPNHHVLCDYGGTRLDRMLLRVHPEPQVSDEYLAYHNNHVVPAAT
jgi:hypothetical protein